MATQTAHGAIVDHEGAQTWGTSIHTTPQDVLYVFNIFQ
jgi:hypothetical protein